MSKTFQGELPGVAGCLHPLHTLAPVEMVVLLYKEDWKRRDRGKTTISREEFIEWTNGMWT